MMGNETNKLNHNIYRALLVKQVITLSKAASFKYQQLMLNAKGTTKKTGRILGSKWTALLHKPENFEMDQIPN